METQNLFRKALELAETLPSETTIPQSNDAAWRPVLDEYDPSLSQAATEMALIGREMALGGIPRWLTITGVWGCGKTFLTRQLFDAAKAWNPGERSSLWIAGAGKATEDNRRPNRVWLTEKSFASILRAGDYDYPKYLRPDFLVVLDDLGSERDPSGFLANALFDLCNARVNRWTIFTTNYSLNEIMDRVDGRVSSRLIRDSNKLVTITARDYALRKRA